MRVVSTPAAVVATLLRSSAPAPSRFERAGVTADFIRSVARGEVPVLEPGAEGAIALLFGIPASSLLHRGVATVARKEGTADGRIPFTASTDTPDRYHDIVDQGSWNLDLFQSNPVMPWGHDYFQPPVGTVEDLTTEPDLGGVACFDREDPLAAAIAGKYDRRVLRAFSVGFRPGRSIPRNQLPKEDPRYGERGYVYYDCELLEISAVSIPANPEALAAKGWPSLTLDPEALAAEVARYLESDAGRAALVEAVRALPEPGPVEDPSARAIRAVFG